MKKLLIAKNEEVTEVVERILGEDDQDVVLIVPRGAVIGRSATNFHLIKREAESAGKTVALESVDENVLAFAKANDIKAAHPLFEGSEKEVFSDIVSGVRKSAPGRDGGRAAEPRRKNAKVGAAAAKMEQREPRREPEPAWTGRSEAGPAEDEDEAEGEGADVIREVRDAEEPRIRQRRIRLRLPAFGRVRWSGRFVFAAIAAVVVLGFAWRVLSGPLARATVVINFEETPWEKKSVVLADASVSDVNFDKNVLPAELFTTTKNLTHLFPASAEKEVERKAKGKMWIYNAYSSAPQALVAATRFEMPDGKIFRIVDRVTVPGAKIKSGKIIPSSIEVDVVADKAGEAYNVGPVARLSVPGFKGAPRYEGFYGEIKSPTSGGFTGKTRVPTSEDIKNAKARMEELLRGGIEAEFLASSPKEFKILDGASRTDITRLNVDVATDEKGNFSVFGEARVRAVGFRESDLRSLLAAYAQKNESGTVFKDLELSYSDAKPDFEKGLLSFSLGAKGTLWPRFSPDEFASGLLGRKVGEVKSLIAALPRFAGGKVSIWPVWLGSIPADPARVKVVVK